MKNLLNQFKEEVGKLLISFGEKLTGEINKTNDKVDALEKRVQALESKEAAAPIGVKSEKKSVVQCNVNPSTKEDLDLLRKFSKDKWSLFEGGKAYNKNFNENMTVEISDFSSNFTYGVYGIAGLPVEVKDYKGNKESQFKLNKDIKDYKEIPLQYEDILAALAITGWRSKEVWNNLCNVRFELKNKTLNILASDGYRIVKKSIKREGEDFSISIKGALLDNIKTDVKKYGHDVKVFVSNNNVKLTYKNRIVTCETKQDFVNYEDLYNGHSHPEVEKKIPDFNIKSIEGYLKTIKSNSFIIRNNKIKDTDIEIDGDVEDLYGSYNIKFIKDALALKPKTICYHRNNCSKPITLKGDYDIIIMPLAIRDENL